MRSQITDTNQIILLSPVTLSKPFAFLAKLYLLAYALYVALLFNVRWDKQLDWYALGLILLGLPCIQ